MILMGMGVQAQIVRVTTWDMAAALRTEKSPQVVIEKTAGQLKAAAPDVILLRGVSGWNMCSQLAEALKPSDYRVVVCSSFREPAGTNAARSQVAILAKNTAYFSWSESWNFETGASPAGGFAFAAVQIAGHRFGFSSLELPSGQSGTSGRAARQWLDTLGSFRTWANNRLEGFVAGTSGLNSTDAETVRLLRAAGFADPQAGRKQAPEAREPIEAHLVPNADAPGGLLLLSWPTTCEFDFRAAPIIVVASNLSAEPESAASLFAAQKRWWWLAGAVTCVLGIMVMIQLATRRKLARLEAQGALIAVGSGSNPGSSLSYNVVMTPQSVSTLTADSVPAQSRPRVLPTSQSAGVHETMLRQGLMAHMAQWLKEAFVRRLVSDRDKLLAAQQVATMKALAVDERLSRLEVSIQEKNSTYEKQVEQLSRELLTAREENRELIRAQINRLKSEMEANRARVLETEGL